ncbi:cupredoxin domain-containing protein [Gordonia sp. X0973]|uniref:iron uptake system protein EfeO n=1 Tax=Gordonia sp. X0973 TaxID=2742602 RepID=UPI000F53A793|nr:iron uptake system protein EfeO [Gordonia sp. X0973]QKT06536.1 cupredoxin domain-containing protein [Gordonia sp. X0973]
MTDRHHRGTTRVLALGAAAAVAPLALGACVAKDSGAATLNVTSSDSACDFDTTTAQTGTVAFKIKNTGSKVTEFYVYDGSRVLGEVENIAPGLSGKLTVDLVKPGTYAVACKPGMVGTGIRKDITVTGEEKKGSEAPADVEQAKKRYLDSVRIEVGNLESATADFVDALKRGDLEAARAKFGPTRSFYERIEPVAESFSDLDPKIDMRWDDTGDGQEDFTGFHRIERFLWKPTPDEIGDAEGKVAPADAEDAKKADTPAAISAIADKLLADVRALKAEVDKPDFKFDTQLFVNGPKALIDEIAKTKVHGEEDRYSHTDLWDFAANVEGSQRLIGELQPIIEKRDANLMKEITAQFDTINAAIDKLRDGSGYLSYDKVDEATRKDLSTKIDALSATLSKVPAVVLGH